jgi:hypothetical protein
MDSRGNYDRSPHSYFLCTRLEVRDNDHLAIISSYGLTQNSLSDPILAFMGRNFGKMLTAVWVSVGIAMGEEYFIFIMLEGYLKSECIVEPATLFLHAVLIIANGITISLPANSTL